MATLVGRKCWVVQLGSIKKGKIIGRQTSLGNNYYSFLPKGDPPTVVHSSSICLTRVDAIARCENEIQYWEDRIHDLENKVDLEEDPK
jgi:hypothetical protein